jgi:hypothetical protein
MQALDRQPSQVGLDEAAKGPETVSGEALKAAASLNGSGAFDLDGDVGDVGGARGW